MKKTKTVNEAITKKCIAEPFEARTATSLFGYHIQFAATKTPQKEKKQAV